MSRFTGFCIRVVWVALVLGGCQPERPTLVVGGGPAGGTFQGYAEALVEVVDRDRERLWRVKPSGGSVSNLTDLNRGEVDLALVYAGDAWLGRQGRLPGQATPANQVRALGRLYGAAAQLVVRDTSPVQQVGDLKGMRVAIGNPGSGTALAAERYFSSLGLWKKIIPIHVGFSMGLSELERGSVQAVWLVVGYPNRALQEEADRLPIRFLDLYSEARESGFFRDYPFYAELKIPAGTYSGQQRRVWTFQDSALLMAREGVDAGVVYRLLKKLYSPEGREELAKRHPIGGELDLKLGLEGVKVPLQAGAERFWRERIDKENRKG